MHFLLKMKHPSSTFRHLVLFVLKILNTGLSSIFIQVDLNPSRIFQTI